MYTVITFGIDHDSHDQSQLHNLHSHKLVSIIISTCDRRVRTSYHHMIDGCVPYYMYEYQNNQLTSGSFLIGTTQVFAQH